MNISVKKVATQTLKASLSTAVLAATLSSMVHAGSLQDSAVKILEVNFDSRKVVQVEAGDFHFKPGQIAPIHTHAAPAVGYVVKGEIIYQIEGEKQVLLREGDAFYEPAGPRILRFDNASATEEAIFVDFNFEQEDEPFIVFEKPPTEVIDRRTLPTVALAGQHVEKVDIFKRDLEPGEAVKVNNTEPALAIVAQGVVIVKERGNAARRVAAGSTFALTEVGGGAKIVNASAEVPAKVITFRVL